MPCSYCGNDVDVVKRKFRSGEEDTVVVLVEVCKRCFKRYSSSLFDACDECKIIQDVRPNTFHIIGGKMLCVKCKDAWIRKK